MERVGNLWRAPGRRARLELKHFRRHVMMNTILAPDNVPFAHFGDSLWLEASGRAAALTFDSVAEAKAYMQTQEYQDVKRMLVSLELRPSK